MYKLNPKPLILLLATLFINLPFGFAMADAYHEGKNYRVLERPGIPSVPGKIEVREFFWYGCPHCYQLEGKISAWSRTLPSDVNFIHTPAVAAPHWELLASGYFAASNLGVAKEAHAALFDALHKDRKRIATAEQLAAFYKDYGVEESAFLAQLNSFAVKTALRKSEQSFRQYGLTGVPAVIVNGKYQVLGQSYDEMLRVVDFLIDKERQAMNSVNKVK